MTLQLGADFGRCSSFGSLGCVSSLFGCGSLSVGCGLRGCGLFRSLFGSGFGGSLCRHSLLLASEHAAGALEQADLPLQQAHLLAIGCCSVEFSLLFG